jgi:GntR family transcriptional regulator
MIHSYNETSGNKVTVPIQIDFRSGIPIYIQIMDQIRQMVVNGDLKPGDQLPTVRQLAIELKVNWNTVARAYRLLDEAGLISTQQGRGTFIWEAPSDETTLLLRQQALAGLTRRYLAEAARLGVSHQEVLRFFQQEIAAWEQGNPPRETIL